jgi:hypothetical protein
MVEKSSAHCIGAFLAAGRRERRSNEVASRGMQRSRYSCPAKTQPAVVALMRCLSPNHFLLEFAKFVVILLVRSSGKTGRNDAAIQAETFGPG